MSCSHEKKKSFFDDIDGTQKVVCEDCGDEITQDLSFEEQLEVLLAQGKNNAIVSFTEKLAIMRDGSNIRAKVVANIKKDINPQELSSLFGAFSQVYLAQAIQLGYDCDTIARGMISMIASQAQKLGNSRMRRGKIILPKDA